MTVLRTHYFILFLCSVEFISAQYEVPEAIVEAYHPKGFSVSIPDEEGIRLFAFHGNINEQINDREAGTFSKDVLKPKNGFWTFSDQSARLRVGDKIYFWTYVEYFDGKEKRGYPKDNQEFTVTRIVHKPTGNDKKTTPRTTSPTTSRTTTATPTTTATTTTTTTPVPIQIESSSPTDTEDTCEPTVTVINGGQSACKGQMIFNEPFNTKIRSKMWTIENRFAGKPDYEFVVYSDRPETIYVADKVLIIKPEVGENVYGKDFVEQPFNFGDRCTGIAGTLDCSVTPDAGFIVPPVVSGKVTTKNKFSFKYGKIEIRAKLPKGDWLYPILTLDPVHEEYGPGYESGQIRVAFAPGNAILNRMAFGGVILGNSPAARKYGIKSVNRNLGWANDYIRYGVTWKEDQIILTVNDKVYGTIFPPVEGFSTLGNMLGLKNADRWKTGSVLAPFDKEMYISLGVGAGGFNFEDTTDGSKPWRNGERLSLKKFYNAQQNWSSTWNEESILSVASVRVWAL